MVGNGMSYNELILYQSTHHFVNLLLFMLYLALEIMSSDIILPLIGSHLNGLYLNHFNSLFLLYLPAFCLILTLKLSFAYFYNLALTDCFQLFMHFSWQRSERINLFPLELLWLLFLLLLLRQHNLS